MLIPRSSRSWLLFILAVLSFWVYRVYAQAYNGFMLSDPLIPLEEIHQGGPPKDGIPALTAPRFLSVDKSGWLSDDALVLSLDWEGEQRAYPLAIMNWHEVVNDQVQNQSIVVTYCPLCGSGMAFLTNVSGRTLSFGVSGLLYNSDVLLYDRETESLWSQLKSQAISGPLKGARLALIPLDLEVWSQWRGRYPQGIVLSPDTGHNRDYSRNPYKGYEKGEALFFPVALASHRYHPKERVLGVELDGRFKAYPFAELSKQGGNVLRDEFQGRQLEIRFNAAARTGRIVAKTGDSVASVNAFWFAWYAFHPDTDVFVAP